MGTLGRTLVMVGTALVAAPGASAQGAAGAYHEAVARFFRLPPTEVRILADWDIADEEIPATLFVARHAGVSPEALVALRLSGMGWSELATKYGIGAAVLHVPVGDDAPTGSLEAAYEQYRTVPVAEWARIALASHDVVALVNVRVIAQTLDLPVEDVIRHAGSTPSYVELFARLRR